MCCKVYAGSILTLLFYCLVPRTALCSEATEEIVSQYKVLADKGQREAMRFVHNYYTTNHNTIEALKWLIKLEESGDFSYINDLAENSDQNAQRFLYSHFKTL